MPTAIGNAQPRLKRVDREVTLRADGIVLHKDRHFRFYMEGHPWLLQAYSRWVKKHIFDPLCARRMEAQHGQQ